jgi:hypothetical protein
MVTKLVEIRWKGCKETGKVWKICLSLKYTSKKSFLNEELSAYLAIYPVPTSSAVGF